MTRLLVAQLAFAVVAASAGLVHADNWYVPSDYDAVPAVSQGVVVSQQVLVSQRVLVSRPVVIAPVTTYVVSRPVTYVRPYYGEPIYVETVASQPIVISHRAYGVAPTYYQQPVVYERPVVYQQPVIADVYVSPGYVTREKFKSRPGRYEYEQKGKFQTYGRNSRTYDYEYEANYKHGRLKTKFDIDD